MEGEPAALTRALAAERLRNGRLLATFRFAGLSVFVVLLALFRLLVPGWIGPLWEVLAYWGLAGALLVLSRRHERVAALGGLTIPLVDMPMLLLALWGSMTALIAAGHPADAMAMRLGAGAFFAVFVFLTSLSLDVWVILLAGAVAAGCEAFLVGLGGPDVTLMLVMAALMGLAATLAAHASRRTLRLVVAVTAEEIRRQRLGRYFSPEVARRIERRGDQLAAGERVEVTVLFCDIRGFTALAESLPAERVVTLLNVGGTLAFEGLGPLHVAGRSDPVECWVPLGS